MARPTLLTSAIGMRMLEHRSGHFVVRMLGLRVVIGALCIALVETVMLAVIVGACAQTPRNEETVAVRLGGHQFEIPGGYFLAVRPVRPETDSILITALMPDMEPMRDNNKGEFLYERGFGNTVSILIDDAHRTTSVGYRLHVAEETGSPYARQPDEYGLEAYTPSGLGIFNPGRTRNEIYIDGDKANLNGFITCDVDGSVPSPVCTYEFADDDLLVTTDFNKKHLPDWSLIGQSVKQLLKKFDEHA